MAEVSFKLYHKDTENVKFQNEKLTKMYEGLNWRSKDRGHNQVADVVS
jgi:hypothetical protein